MLHLIPEFIERQVLPLVSIGSYTFAKVLGFVQVSGSIKDSWHFLLLQELAFAAAILSFGLALTNFILTRFNKTPKKKSNAKVFKVPRSPKTKN